MGKKEKILNTGLHIPKFDDEEKEKIKSEAMKKLNDNNEDSFLLKVCNLFNIRKFVPEDIEDAEKIRKTRKDIEADQNWLNVVGIPRLCTIIDDTIVETTDDFLNLNQELNEREDIRELKKELKKLLEKEKELGEDISDSKKQAIDSKKQAIKGKINQLETQNLDAKVGYIKKIATLMQSKQVICKDEKKGSGYRIK
jgi:hypothetical protein